MTTYIYRPIVLISTICLVSCAHGGGIENSSRADLLREVVHGESVFNEIDKSESTIKRIFERSSEEDLRIIIEMLKVDINSSQETARHNAIYASGLLASRGEVLLPLINKRYRMLVCDEYGGLYNIETGLLRSAAERIGAEIVDLSPRCA